METMRVLLIGLLESGVRRSYRVDTAGINRSLLQINFEEIDVFNSAICVEQ